MPESPTKPLSEWLTPKDIMKLHKLKQKKKSLQARISGGDISEKVLFNNITPFENVLRAKKRKNPFIVDDENKKIKPQNSDDLDESSDQTLFKLLHRFPQSENIGPVTSFTGILEDLKCDENIEIVKAAGKKHLPIDWALKTKVRLLSNKPFPWSQKLKISEEAAGVTGFTRCLDSTMDTSPNAKFHQCCFYWQQPSLPWMNLFPRTNCKSQTNSIIAKSSEIKESLLRAWYESFRSLFQLIRTKQCPFFYVCANTFTALFRADGLCGYGEIHVLVTPTTHGFRQMLKQEEIEYTMPLSKKRLSNQRDDMSDSMFGVLANNESVKSNTEEALDADEEGNDAIPDSNWLKSIGISCEEIKQINYTQDKINHKFACQQDNSEESLVFIEGVEVLSFYNFLLNCKSVVSSTGPFAGIPPTLLAPVAFNGSTLKGLKVREDIVKEDDLKYYSLELRGPILPTILHNLLSFSPLEQNMTATFVALPSTASFSKIKMENKDKKQGLGVFGKENLSECGLKDEILKQLCSADKLITNIECVKYNCDNNTYTWT